ncbi:ABC transporter permease [Patiriisocius marinus]|uniref:Membrane protein n=1 Tax=Patiriisocius marinus TaxID=1397112 RepID=A0A5J4IYC3_9FLAO|nr:FtsX-like permease family protein [Patiriisocius marinus]GER58618.1 membrane protein [Patiriisocius marinus]
MNFSLYIAKRYLFSLSSNNAINIITIIAATGVVVSSLVLFIVLSGFSGLKDFSLQYTSIFDPDLKVLPSSGKTINFSDAQQLQLSKIDGVSSYSQIIEERIFMQFRGKKTIGYIKGVDENFGNVNAIDSIMIVAPWFEPNKQEVVIGYGISQKLGLGARDYLNFLEIFVPKPGIGQLDPLNPGKDFNKESVVVSGVYFVNEELNSKYVFSDLNFARNLLSLDSTKISGLEIKLKEGALENDVRDQISQIFNNDILLKNRIEQNDALYKMLNTENVAVYLICTLVMIIALFNVIGSIIMMILDKRKNIKTLYNMGATLSGIRRIFFLQGALMTFLGGVLGIILGVIVVWLQLKFEFIHITPTLPYPVKLKFENILIVFATISILGLLAATIAASRVRERLIE